MAEDHGWRGSGRFRAARVDGRLVLRFGYVSTRGGSLKQAIGAFFRKEYRAVAPDYAPYAVDVWIEGDGLLSKRLDVDNVAKACLDALTGVVWRDDRQVVRLSVEKVQAGSEAITLAIGPAAPPPLRRHWNRCWLPPSGLTAAARLTTWDREGGIDAP